MIKKIISIVVILLVAKLAFAWPRLGQGATPVFQNSGTYAKGVSVILSSTTATVIYTRDDNDREILLQNNGAYAVYIGTFSALTATSGPRIKLLPTFNYMTNNTATLYGIVEVNGADSEIIGIIEYDAKDKISN